MGERRNPNKYYPPSWDPSKGGLNKFHGQHYLRERAKKLVSDGILIIRFELPWNMWCGGCQKMIGRGTRFNASKKTVGSYFSTKILSFKMKHVECDHEFEIRTDPKNAQYILYAGGTRKEEEFSAEDAETIKLLDDDVRERIRADPMAMAEHARGDAVYVRPAKARLGALMRQRDDVWKDDAAANSILRQQLRERKKDRLRKEVADRADFKTVDLPLLSPNDEDSRMAKDVDFKSRRGMFTKKVLDKYQKRAEARIGNIFAGKAGTGKRGRISASAVVKKQRKSGLDHRLFAPPP